MRHHHRPVGRGRAGHRDDRGRGLIASELNLSGGFWNWFEHIDINFLGFVIVGMFVATWAIALSVWKFGHIEERWTAHLGESQITGQG
jgi:high-affinity nickel-transport protein